jgi:hypothetical protein
MLTSYRLPVSFQNRVVEAMGQLGLDGPPAFEWTDYTPGITVQGERIVHVPTRSHFQYYVPVASTSIWCEWAPATGNGTQRQGHVTGDAALVEQIKEWLRVVKREYEAPNLWEALRGESALITDAAVEGELYFTPDEQRRLAERIDQLEVQIKALAPQATQEQRVHVHVTLQHAKDAATRVSRIDWKSIFVGKLLDIVVTLGLEPQKAQQLLHFATLYIAPFVSHVKGLLS